MAEQQTDPATDALPATQQRSWVRLRTLILLRWAAIAGQIAAIAVAVSFFSVQIPFGLVAAVIGAAVIANLVFSALFPRNTRLNERRATGILVFDTLQLGAMMFLTGGIHNPFMVLILAPVTVAATALSTRSTVIVGAIAVAATSFVTWINLPLQTASGVLQMPSLFVFGLWAAVTISVGFIGLYTHRISSEMRSMSEALLATQMALSREQNLTDLGGVVAAAAHELGTPLATIKLVSSELVEELEGQDELRDDARLIGEQANRCRDILQSMGRAGKDDMLVKHAPLIALIDEAAEPHRERGKSLEIEIACVEADPMHQPVMVRRPEIIHGLRNLIQNAVDFASTKVWIEMCWNDERITIRILDDGKGYSPQVLGWIGDPFIRRRKSQAERGQRQAYKGMGLGLFIAKTLLERTGATLNFANASSPYTGRPHPREKSGAIAQVEWQRGTPGLEATDTSAALGENTHFTHHDG
ncbi:two-component system, sensor histidine kinase RegB [Aliiroseovarius halocynthiae]|uniref:histidine kinase n=1 Tax=Aliiroseovarius halocynthiae TaxID=985055 RepID=A0A545SNM6_9RHOB|nr:ActS/PrrB/RegB family redox-sensitive histidine kinase [Aliiroseovarius halocynthiae]TQV66561.1 ActS/PrrB/RegB family redox-sensitive histidine kinase [Aliiroseovarius halocynthiae]SMR82571.1 two-component system, sensor histidine kinase RegB [Aliiroseovarius halocynthiae]